MPPPTAAAPALPASWRLSGWGFVAAVFAFSWWPPAVAVVPALGLLQGRFGVVAAVASVLSFLAPRAEARWKQGLAQPPWVLSALAAVLFLVVGLAYASRLRVSGDEPHYLILAQSLWREGDLDLADNYSRQDWLEYTPGPVQPHYGAPRADGRPFPAHSIGLPLLLAPVYAAGGRLACVALLAVLAAGLTGQTYALARQVGGEAGAGWAWGLATGPPVLFYAFHVYTEVPSALALVVGLRLLLRCAEGGGTDVAASVGAALAFSALPWLHLKLALAAVVAGMAAAVLLRGRARAAFVAVAGIAGLAFAGHFQRVFGVPWPTAIYAGAGGDFSGRPLLALGGLLLDRSFGVLPIAPVLVIGLAGWPALLSRRGPSVRVLATVALAVAAPLFTWRMWWGGQCPPGRFLVPLVPFLAVAAAARGAEGPGRGLMRWAAALAACGLVGGVALTWEPGALLLVNRGDRPTRLWDALATPSVSPARYLPSIVGGTSEEQHLAALWGVALGLLLVLDRRALRSDRMDRLLGWPGLPTAVLVSISTIVDRVIRP